MSTLRERAARWLKGYKNGMVDEAILPIEDRAAIVSEYLHNAKEDVLEKYEELQNENEQLREMNAEVKEELADIKTRLNTSEFTRESLASDLFEARGKIKAYEFVIRCNGVSGAEV